ncbi:hypothetical protein B0S90_0490 [Caldicellulosiruptor bescii]|uniref:Adhesin domain-containing protein n=2 Tax=Caldicellulosiruptor bescii TaxID=31899 RepID=B9MME0_CALBD|nr:hypothetical protein [Caldicellulosiruptor bescii]ACM59372.1 conserved hypothetical protein [Caldicellulosiruptor bescii DSM 6725]PBC88171.1 hypothetical protein B0S87_1135 [Caldicellulosiruptor bescii]PBC92348.1 hypothetical protein B0S89_2858 [Caldicellulosiruptor bescii]PBD04841.1 hypothetical protein B0S85_2550 [Caldicellulosiruptor bescii]PBD05529.1 hypothetical protein B0S90_0490 [Caldicellulosiruptor bescii]
MKFKLMIILLTFLLMLVACTPQKTKTKEFSQEGRWTVLDYKGKAFVIDCDSSFIAIRGKKATSDIAIRYIKKVVWTYNESGSNVSELDEKELQKIFDDMDLSIENEVDRVYVKARAYTTSEAVLANKVSNPKREFEFEVFLPQDCKVVVQNNSGSVSVSDIKDGSVYIVNGVGNIAVTNTGVPLDIKNGEGDIKLDYVSGDFLINNGKGNINLKIEKTGSFKVSTTKGNVVAKIDRINGYGNSSFVSVGEGDISFAAGKGVKAKIKILAKGKVKSDFDLTKTGNSYYIDLDSGGNTIEITSLKGFVRIYKNY